MDTEQEDGWTQNERACVTLRDVKRTSSWYICHYIGFRPVVFMVEEETSFR